MEANVNKLPVDPKIPQGTVVYDAEGQLLGTVEDTTEAFLTMTDRRNKPTFYYIPASEVDSWDGTQVRLKATMEEVRLSAWDLGPPPEPTQPP